MRRFISMTSLVPDLNGSRPVKDRRRKNEAVVVGLPVGGLVTGAESGVAGSNIGAALAGSNIGGASAALLLTAAAVRSVSALFAALQAASPEDSSCLLNGALTDEPAPSLRPCQRESRSRTRSDRIQGQVMQFACGLQHQRVQLAILPLNDPTLTSKRSACLEISS